MSKTNTIKEIDNISPKSIFEFVKEQIYQNDILISENKRKLTTCFYGPPGVGKTEILEKFPLYNLELINNEIIQKYLPGYSFSYNYYDPLDEQNEKVLTNIKETLKITDESTASKDNLEIFELIKNNFIYEFETEVVVVTQSDIILPEDISGLPSSMSEIGTLNESINLAKTYKEILKESTFLDAITKKAKVVLDFITGTSDVEAYEADVATRNTTKFDYTEWELKAHKAASKPGIKHVILVLDDIFRAANNNTSILNVMMPMFQQALVGQRPLPKNCSVVVTSNNAETDGDEINYVAQADQAQKDRLFSYNVAFNIDDWADHMKRMKVNPTIVSFAQINPHVFSEKTGIVTPRRWTQFGETLYNRFGFNEDAIYNHGPENTANQNLLNFMLKFNFGDVTNERNKKIITEFKSFISNIGSEINDFVNKMMKNGYDEELQGVVKNLIVSGQALKLNIIAHKLISLFSEQLITKKFAKGISDFFYDEIIPLNVKWLLRKISPILIEMEMKVKQDETKNLLSEDYKKLAVQIRDVATETLTKISKEREEVQEKKLKMLDDAQNN